MPSRSVHAHDFGGSWPFSVDHVTLTCEDGAVTVTSQGVTYALNDTAAGRASACGWRDVAPLLRERSETCSVRFGATDLAVPVPRACIIALIHTGLALCPPRPVAEAG